MPTIGYAASSKIRSKETLMSFIHVALLLVAAAPERLDLTGRVTAAAGTAVKGANVMIYTARVRKGTNALCPSCYADCSKQAEPA
jgi:hypothetical protein